MHGHCLTCDGSDRIIDGIRPTFSLLGRTHHNRHDLGFGEVELLGSLEKRRRNGQAPTSTSEVNRPAAMGDYSPRKKRSFALTHIICCCCCCPPRVPPKENFWQVICHGHKVVTGTVLLLYRYAAIAVPHVLTNSTKHFSFRPQVTTIIDRQFKGDPSVTTNRVSCVGMKYS
jgi:hypothetical protein